MKAKKKRDNKKRRRLEKKLKRKREAYLAKYPPLVVSEEMQAIDNLFHESLASFNDHLVRKYIDQMSYFSREKISSGIKYKSPYFKTEK